ncbi:hypothetical protein [Polymorphospora rubra]|uniref:hypothetical protein n=1 Tax=Polymorphospora rubra TaxID=338584 RepID=UPI0033F17E39
MDLGGDYDGIAPSITALKSCGDPTLVPLLHQALDRFLDDGNFYGRDLIADILASSQEVAALPVLLRASSRDLGDDQDTLSALIIDLMDQERVAARVTVLEFAASHVRARRRGRADCRTRGRYHAESPVHDRLRTRAAGPGP